MWSFWDCDRLRSAFFSLCLPVRKKGFDAWSVTKLWLRDEPGDWALSREGKADWHWIQMYRKRRELTGESMRDPRERDMCSNSTRPKQKVGFTSGQFEWRQVSCKTLKTTLHWLSFVFLWLSLLWHSVYCSLWQTPPIWEQVKKKKKKTCQLDEPQERACVLENKLF